MRIVGYFKRVKEILKVGCRYIEFGVLVSCDDKLVKWYLCLVKMKSKFFVWVFNVRDERVCVVKGMYIEKSYWSYWWNIICFCIEWEGEIIVMKSFF